MSNQTNIRKRIVICCDGTWQSSVSGEANIPSNVTRLCRIIARTGTDNSGNTWQQVVYYDSGVGTGALASAEKSRQGAVGDGLAVNVIEAYNFIVLNYSPGDEIFCFGFSRGAYTARAVAGLVADIGVLEPRAMQIFPEIYTIYKKNIPKQINGKGEFVQVPFRETEEWIEFSKTKESTGEVEISEESRNVKVVGVWDTVGALGVPDGRFTNLGHSRTQHGFHNVKLNKHIENAFQALALDERRKAFSPTLWYIPKHRLEAKDKSNLLQVWFPGVHISVGGGSSDTAEGKGDAEEMANITFAWMIECVRPYLAFNKATTTKLMSDYHTLLATLFTKNNPQPSNPSQTNIFQKAYNSLPYVLSSPEPQSPLKIGWGTAEYIDSFDGVMTYPGEKVRSPGQCETEVVVQNKSMLTKHLYTETTETRKLEELGETNEEIHPVARFRREQTGLKNGGLEGWEVRARKGVGKGYEWVNNGGGEGGKKKLVLPEYVIQKKSVERILIQEVEEAQKFIKKTDVGNGIL